MLRRAILALSFVLSFNSICPAFAADAPQAGRVWRIGFLVAASKQWIADSGTSDAFLQGMRDLGYVEGKNLLIEWRFADGIYERLPSLAEELVGLKVDVIVAVPSPAIRAAKQATATIPIVFPMTGDPVGSGFAASLAHPEGNLTGLSNTNLDISAKTLELLLSAAPRTSRIALLGNPGSSPETAIFSSIAAAGKQVGVQTFQVEARTPEEIERAFTTMKRERADALVIAADTLLTALHPHQIAELAVKHRLPSITQGSIYVRAGGLMSYGQDPTDNFRRAAVYVDKILKGAKPGELPIEQPTKLRLLINAKTAQALGLTIPQSLLLRADEVIQ